MEELEIPEGMKKCSICPAILPATPEFFQKAPDSKTGLKRKCKKCSSEQAAHYRQDNKEFVLQSNKRWRDANKEEAYKKAAIWRQQNREEINEKARQKRGQDPEKERHLIFWAKKSREERLQHRKDLYYANHEYSLAQHKLQRERRPEHLLAVAHREMKAKGKKYCRGCSQWLPATLQYFHSEIRPNKPNKIPFASRCKECSNKRNREDPWGRRNPERAQIIKRRWDRNHPEQAKEIHRQWKKNHSDWVRAQGHNRRAKIRLAPGTHTPQELLEQYQRQKGRCYYCHISLQRGKRKVYHVDHTFPISRPGARNDISYLVITCPPCNQSKGSKYPWEWYRGGRLL